MVARLNTVLVDFDRWMKKNEDVERVVDALDYIEENETKEALVEELKKVNKCSLSVPGSNAVGTNEISHF